VSAFLSAPVTHCSDRLVSTPEYHAIARGRFRPQPKDTSKRLRINDQIRISPVRLIDENNDQVGIIETHDALSRAKDAGLDLVEVAPNTRPPVCRIMDYGKFKYDKKKQRQASKSSQPTVKTVQMRPKTDDHDLNTKLSRARRFLERGDKVKLVMRMRGRERAYPERWIEMMREHFHDALANFGRIASKPSQQGRVISMVVEPG